MDYTEIITRAAEAIANADALFITAGAGIGVDSGLPDFRGNQGFWQAYPPIARLGLSFTQMANPSWFDQNPRLAWAFYGHRLNLYRRTTPHQGFTQLLDMARQKRAGYFVFTSNVDGQFQRAGFDAERIEECHGSIHHFQCRRPCNQMIWDAHHIKVDVDEDAFEAHDPLPRCIRCNNIARPNILMFGDWAWIADRTDQQDQRLRDWFKQITRERLRLAIIEVGAGESVPTVRMKSEAVADMHNATLIRINPRDHAVPRGQIALPFGGAEGIGLVYAELNRVK